MSLDNLVKTGQLKVYTASRSEIGDLLAAARRNLDDAHAENISTENRFDAAYKGIMQASLVALMANGYRPDTKTPGHHRTVIQTLPKTVDMPAERVAVLDALRNKRNLSDYSGKPIDPASLRACIDEGERLLREVTEWLATNRPELAP